MKPVRLRVLSDLHLERGSAPPVAQPVDVLVLAGDIDNGTRAVERAEALGAGRPVLFVAGNHEYYGHAIDDVDRELQRRAEGTAVQVLENGEAVIDGVRFLGATLWSDFDFGGETERELSMRVSSRLVNDFRHIRRAGDRLPFTPEDARSRHLASRAWLAERLATAHAGPTVVITHHAPVIRTRPERSILRAVAGAFASDLTDLMGSERTPLWIFGHTHVAADLDVAGTRVLSNPRGYPDEAVAGYDEALVVEVG